MRFESRLFLALLLVPLTCFSQIQPSEESLEGLYKGKTYSPYAKRAFPTNVYWGDTHLHTSLSLDAGMFGNTLGLEQSYRFNTGKEIVTSTGLPAKLGRPLDWLVVSDHSDMMGFADDFTSGAPNVLAIEQSKAWYDLYVQGGEQAVQATLDLIRNFSQGTLDERLLNDYSPASDIYKSVWQRVIDAAEKYNDPGTFTAFIGYEWTSLDKGNNLHRNVILRDNGDKASQVVPMVTQPPLGSTDPLDLYEWLEKYEEETGGTALALAHNGNLSNGIMFPVDRQFTGKKIDQNYVELRGKWEPMYEITQIKGDGETHPLLSTEDEFADYETWDVGNLDLSQAKTDDMLSREYARAALKSGLQLEEKFGTNPYKFGLVGSTDSHTSMSTAEEENFFGKSAGAEPSPKRMEHPFMKSDLGVFEGYQMVASGMAAVWAEENTREALFDAMARREVYGTTGPRIMVRFFGGWDFTENDLRSRQPVVPGYERGVPMGGDMRPSNGASAPTFMVYALRDPIGANLDRIQIVKGWMTDDGETHEKVYDVTWSGDRQRDANGKVPPVGNTVDLEAAGWTNTIGASELATVWTDPDFDPSLSAFYYARVLEIPTPRWVVYDALRFGIEVPEGAELIGQERAYTSPIWYSP
ncbi:MAG: DUF3604 domain-containing protein [Gammaproteobacteria bacterium]|nr:DUF3604 domain-containing protein [Gammaproteobacteria bacterium]NNL96476.1 DUF3604 domain-containing protein [Xanthomonadales bacterium]